MIIMLEVYVMMVDLVDYFVLIVEFLEVCELGFEYVNLGYNIYGVILEIVIGKFWQDWMDDVLFDLMGWDQILVWILDFLLDELVWSYIWMGEDGGWYEVCFKIDGMMQLVGGLVILMADMVEFL